METICSSGTSGCLRTIRCYTPEDLNLRSEKYFEKMVVEKSEAHFVFNTLQYNSTKTMSQYVTICMLCIHFLTYLSYSICTFPLSREKALHANFKDNWFRIRTPLMITATSTQRRSVMCVCRVHTASRRGVRISPDLQNLKCCYRALRVLSVRPFAYLTTSSVWRLYTVGRYDDWWTRKDLEGSVSALIEVLFLNLPGGLEESRYRSQVLNPVPLGYKSR
jgi:hypothetical protein